MAYRIYLREGLLELLNQLPGEAAIRPALRMHATGRRPRDHVARRPQAGAGSKEVAADAGLTCGENRHRVAEPFAVAAVDDTAFHGIDAVAVFMHHHVRIGCVGTTATGLEEIDG